MKSKTFFASIFWLSLIACIVWTLVALDTSELSDIERQLLLIRKSISYATVFLAYIAWRVTP